MTRILIVEDERIVAWSIREILQTFNYEVVASVTSGTQAIQIAVAAKPDLILMDVRLEGEMDGITATQRIQMQLDIPVVYLTAYADDRTLNQAVATAPFGYIVKPFTRRSLRAAVETALYRHRSEQQLKASQQWFVNTFNSLGDAAIATNAEGQIMFMNAAAEKLTGWEQAEALGKPANQILTFIHAQTREAIENSLLQAIRDGVSVSCADNYMLQTKDGLERAIGDSATPIKTAQGEIIGGVMVFQDITERWQAEQALQSVTAGLEQEVQERTTQLQRALEFETILKRITDRLRDSLDENQIVQAVVEELVRGLGIRGGDTSLFNFERGTLDILYEYTMDQSSLATEIPLESYSDVLPWLQAGQSLQFCEAMPRPFVPTWEHWSILACPIQNEQGILGDLWLFKNPEATFSELEIRLVQQVANQCAIALRQARLYRASQEQIEQLKQLTCLKDELLSTLSYELRTPISSIKLATEMLKHTLEELGVLHEEENSALGYLQILEKEGQREINLIDNLLDLSLLDAGVEPLLLDTIDLRGWLPHVIEPFAKRTHLQQQQLELFLLAQLPTITTDLLYLERILKELLENACKYTLPGERIIVTANAVEQGVQLSVINTGVEIPECERDRIFEKFYRIPGQDASKYGSTGLGLALVKKLVKHLGGTIQVNSHSKQTIFTVQLPLESPKMNSDGLAKG